MTWRVGLAAAATIAGLAAVAALAPRPSDPPRTERAPSAPRAPSGPRSVAPDAVRAGQIAGQLAEARFRIARGARCADPGLAPVADAFAAARVAPDAADWAALGTSLDAVLTPLEPCADPGVAQVVTRLLRWREAPPLR